MPTSDREARDVLAELEREQRDFETFLAGVRVGTRIPADVDAEEFRERVLDGFDAHVQD
ncbi:hypothetical protein [Halosimplex halophilum]|uniref:hypothetical protein n=1 Tax=Halosimplex halophilum TaxID=2559572 RepID=UPI0014355B1F|nr:hypothetical protein [Halosimplex halophilum]